MVCQVRGLFIQTAERSSAVLSIGSPKREMWMEGPRFTVEAATHQSPFDILLQTSESRTRFDAHPDHVRAADRRKGTKTLYRQIEPTRRRSHMIKGILNPFQTLLRDVAEKLQGHVVVLRFYPTNGKLTFP